MRVSLRATQSFSLHDVALFFKMAAQLRVWCALVTAQLGFGAYGVIVTKFAKDSNADPLVFCLLRDTGAFPVMLLTAFLVEGKVSMPSLR